MTCGFSLVFLTCTVSRKRAIEILEKLADKKTSEDRFLLARLYDETDDWPRAEENYRELNLRTRTIRDMETFNRRPVYLAQFATRLLQRHKRGDTQDLADAQELIDEIKRLQPTALPTLALQVEIHRIRGEIKQAVDLIQAFVSQPNLAPEMLAALANTAEKLPDLPLAEQLYTRQANLPGPIHRKLALAMFLGRQDKIDKGLDICEPLWANVRDVEAVAVSSINVLFGSESNVRKPERSQISRVAGWFEKAIQAELTPNALLAMADMAERRLEDLTLAERLYRRQADLPGPVRGKLHLAMFLGRHNKIDEGLNICERLWASVSDVETVAATSINVLFGSEGNEHSSEPAQIERVAGWLEKAIAQAKTQGRRSPLLYVVLGNLREQQDRYPDAEGSYLRAKEEGDGGGVSLNNLAWLTAIKDQRYKKALAYANEAIALKPDQPDFLDTRGMVYLGAGDAKLALEDLQRAVSIDPSAPAKQFHLAQAYLANHDKENARQSLELAKSKGLTPNRLHKLERPNYQSVLNELKSE
jgi:tetratricopeptide (TPR) repeat protein